MKNFFYIAGILIVISSCQGSASSSSESSNNWLSDSLFMDSAYSPSSLSDGFIDSVMPFIAKKHDSMNFNERFDSAYKSHYTRQKTDKQYQIIYSGNSSNGYSYFMLRRLEPSMKNDKYAVLCARFKRNASGLMDTATFEELFWTWKMPLKELNPKAALLFRLALKQKDLKNYMPGKENDLYIMFPDGNASYDQKNKVWKTAAELK